MSDSFKDHLNKLIQQLSAGAPSVSEASKREARASARLRLDRIEDAKVPLPRIDRQRIARDECIATHAMRLVRAWHQLFADRDANECPRVLTLVGPTGRGKTMAGAWLIAIEGGVYVSALELRKRLLSGHWRDIEWADRILRSRIVVLDDVGTETGDSDALAATFELVNQRMGSDGALTLITCNLTGEEFAKRYGERTVRRIEHDGRIVEVKGEDLRRKPGGDSGGSASTACLSPTVNF
jgi:hypothetical protein